MAARYATRQAAKRAADRRRHERRRGHTHSPAEKAARRAEHADRLADAIAELESLDGFARWIESRTLNPQLSAGNVALAAVQLPGQVVGDYRHWRAEGSPVRKGQRASAWITGRSFWPRAVWGHVEVGHPLARVIGADEAPMPARAEVEQAHAAYLARVREGQAPLEALAAVPEVDPDPADPYVGHLPREAEAIPF